MMQQFFYDFWQRRNPENPYMGWMTYKSEVDKVNAKYSSFKKKGYDTDQGRIYLQYGPPNAISPNYNEPNTYPYEIWQYYKIKNQTNRKFVFYSLEFTSKSFVLLHSDAIGEKMIPNGRCDCISVLCRTLTLTRKKFMKVTGNMQLNSIATRIKG